MPRQPVPAGSSWEPVAQQLLSVFPTGPPTRAARHGEGAPIHHVKSSQVKSKRKELKLESIGTLRKKEGQASSAVHVLFTSVSAKINSGAKTWTHTCPLSVCVWKCSYEVPMNIYILYIQKGEHEVLRPAGTRSVHDRVRWVPRRGHFRCSSWGFAPVLWQTTPPMRPLAR